jgi:phosphate acetyltransferase
MPGSIYITSAEGHTGKSMIALGLLDALQQQGRNVGIFRPVSRSHAEADGVLQMLLRKLNPGDSVQECVGVTYEDVHTDPDGSIARIISNYKVIQDRHDVVLILGSDYTDISSPTELAYNARIAANLAAPVLLVLGGRTQDEDSPSNSQFITGDPRTAGEMRQFAEMAITELQSEHAHLLGVIANRVDQDDLPPVHDALVDAVEDAGDVPVWTLPEDPVLVAPSLRDLMRALDGMLEIGTADQLDNDVLGYVVSGMSMENVLIRLIEGAAIVVAGDRSEVVLAVHMAHNSETFPKLAGVIMNGGFEMSPPIKRLISGMTTDLPIINVPHGTFETARRITHTRGRLATASDRKLALALDHFRNNVDGPALVDLIDTGHTHIVTPLMFEHQLTERARSNRKHIVLPEGNDDRILIAAAQVIARDAAEITILGNANEIAESAERLGIDLSAAHILSTNDPELVEKFAQEYARLRAHKGMTIERAREIVTDVSYFGTMMVHLGMADGMVSGAAHTTAHTIRPSFEIIKTQPDVSIVSSVFFMSLPDRVLVYGDCAVNPNPTAEQLADIAISSARSAQQFDIEPRVAMLSYSTGESGTGDEVEKVREATRLVHERQPDLLVEGPIQYDAASDAAVGASKMPGSQVAGQATVFIFPDLNTGNNTYKAVQRSAGAVAIGPMLQGLNKPINDLSRGALVKDIVNTIAITVIQAQGTSAKAPTGTGA